MQARFPSFQLTRIAISGDISPNPGPSSVCSICNRTVARNHRVLDCNDCKTQFHIKCVKVTPSQFKRMKTQNSTWTCSVCIWKVLPFNWRISTSSESELDVSNHSFSAVTDIVEQQDPLEDMVSIKQTHFRQGLLIHQNINSLENKFEELKFINDKIKASIVLTETKIDSSYPDSQFRMQNYCMYRNDRAKGGGAVLIYVSSKIPVKRLKPLTDFKTIEPLLLELQNSNVILLGLYRQPRHLNQNYFSVLEDELNKLLSWITSLKQTIIIT